MLIVPRWRMHRRAMVLSVWSRRAAKTSLSRASHSGPGEVRDRFLQTKLFLSDLFLSSTAVHFLKTCVLRAHVARTLGRVEIEERLNAIIRRSGEETANRLRDEIRILASALNLKKEASTLDMIIGALLGTRETELTAPSAIARRLGRPYDPDRLVLFQILHASLRDHPPFSRMVPVRSPEANTTLAFFEAYVSNFIEGTEFAVDEAADIVFRGIIPNERPADAHDVLGTWRIVSDHREMSRTAGDAITMEVLLKARHASIIGNRPAALPGTFKQAQNRAGFTAFVAPELVPGTSEKGFELFRSLETAFQRAVFMKVPCVRGPPVFERQRQDGSNHDEQRVGGSGGGAHHCAYSLSCQLPFRPEGVITVPLAPASDPHARLRAEMDSGRRLALV